MGKRSGRHSAAQAEISALLVEKAQEYSLVVRLKGGDPFVFGRGGEELLALRAAGVPCEVVPGISSAIAIPELAGIPVTHRGLSRSFHVVTAHSAATATRCRSTWTPWRAPAGRWCSSWVFRLWANSAAG